MNIFIISILIAGLALIIERIAGIDWDYHPDVVTYVATYRVVTEQGWQALPNQLYYFIADWVGGSLSLLVVLNIISYGFTNVLISKSYFEYESKLSEKGRTGLLKLIVLVWLLFTPYRIHLAVHGLKDTLIILLLCFFSYSYRRYHYSLLSWIPLLLLRVYSIFYMTLFVRAKYLMAGMVVIVILIVSFDYPILEFLLERNEIDMRAREFDTIPSFSEMGLKGTILRMLVWPLLIVSGAFAVISPALLFMPIAIEAILARLWSRYMFGNWGLTIGIVLCLMVIAAFVNGFTAYIRYVYPVMIAAPIIVMRRKMT